MRMCYRQVWKRVLSVFQTHFFCFVYLTDWPWCWYIRVAVKLITLQLSRCRVHTLFSLYVVKYTTHGGELRMKVLVLFDVLTTTYTSDLQYQITRDQMRWKQTFASLLCALWEDKSYWWDSRNSFFSSQLSDSIKNRKFLDYTSDYQLLKKNSLVWS
jgi:hypothetical protein